MKPIYIKSGKSLLPGVKQISSVLQGRQSLELEPLMADLSLGLSEQAAFLPDSNLKEYGAGRMVRKTSERQARWVIDVALASWQADVAPERSGVFLGLGTVDCEDDDLPIQFDGSLQNFAEQMLSESKPLAGLTLLNSTTASHIAQLNEIKGPSAVFSPFTDAGAQAILEASFNLQLGKCEQALVAAGGQKITPWFYLAYRDYFEKWPTAFATESASALTLSFDRKQADAQLLLAKRGFLTQATQPLPLLDKCFSELAAKQIELPNQVIFTGLPTLAAEHVAQLHNYLAEFELTELDQTLGFTGPAGALHASQLAAERLLNSPANAAPILIISQGHHGQICYLLIGGIDA